jgi:uncharacterized membrane protein
MLFIAEKSVIFALTQSQTMNDKRFVGLLFVVAVVQNVLALLTSEAVYSFYSVGRSLVSELGDWSLAGDNAVIFNASAVLYGLLIIAGAFYIRRVFKSRLFSALLAVNGVCSFVSGVVAMNISFEVHGTFSLIAFVGIMAAAFMSYKFVKAPLSYISVLLGALTLSAIVLFMLGRGNSDFYLGLGAGGIERFIIYPMALWLLGFGAYLIGDSGHK